MYAFIDIDMDMETHLDTNIDFDSGIDIDKEMETHLDTNVDLEFWCRYRYIDLETNLDTNILIYYELVLFLVNMGFSIHSQAAQLMGGTWYLWVVG